MSSRAPVAAVIPAKDEAARIAATIAAAQTVPGVDLVVVVDDGSRDATSELARRAGAVVVRHPRNRGKAAAMTTGAFHVIRQDAHASLQQLGAESARSGSSTPGTVEVREHLLLFVDADLEGSAARLGVLVPPVASARSDMTIAILPPQERPGGGRGLVVRLARQGIASLTGWNATQPLSGMRCLNRTALNAALPLARGWGVEVGLTIDVLHAGLTVSEVPCELHHRVTGSDWRGQLHRARQYRDVWRALAERRLRRVRA